jgi:hypothetical protein
VLKLRFSAQMSVGQFLAAPHHGLQRVSHALEVEAVFVERRK